MITLYATFDEYGGIFENSVSSNEGAASAIYELMVDEHVDKHGSDGGVCFGSFTVAPPEQHKGVEYIKGFRAEGGGQ